MKEQELDFDAATRSAKAIAENLIARLMRDLVANEAALRQIREAVSEQVDAASLDNAEDLMFDLVANELDDAMSHLRGRCEVD